MSFCQNKCQGHQNHHCVHAHNCTSHNHKNVNKNCKKNKTVDLMPTVPNKSIKHLKKIDQQNQQCYFNQNYGGFYQRQACQNCKKISEQLVITKKKYEDIRKQTSQLQKKNSKICEENRQLHGVIEYYREELGRITKCSSEDARNQIKRHMKQNTQLITKNKSFQHKLYQYEQIIQKLTKENEELYKIINGLKTQKNQISLSYNLIWQKFRKLKAEDSNKQGDMSVERKKNEQGQHRYQIIVEEIRINLQKNIKQNRKLSNQNQNLKEQVQIYKVKISNNQKISKMEIQSIIQREKVLKMKIQSYQKEIKQLRQQLSKTEQALKLKEEELLYSKKVIQKQLKQINQNKQLFNKFHDKENLDQNHDHQNNNESHIHRSQPLGQHNRNDQQIIIELKKQITGLKQKIIVLEGQAKGKGGHNTQSIQQYIITIGASEAFKRIIDEKNQFIKKLIKQKEALLKKIT